MKCVTMRRRLKWFLFTLIVFVFVLLAYWESSLSKSLKSNQPRQFKLNKVESFIQSSENAADHNIPKAPGNITIFGGLPGHKFKQSNFSNKTQSGLHIMILARMRTGSTLIGEIFNQNPDIFYLFEPLHAIDCYVRRNIIVEDERMYQSKVLLQDITKCRFVPKFIDCVMAWGLGRFKSNVLREVCDSTRKCSMMTPEMLSKKCEQYNDQFAMKMIRGNLEMIRPLVTEKGMNVKVIHLIRDPRGTANSRKKYYNDMLNRSKGKPKIRSMKELGLLELQPKTPYKVNTVLTLCQWMRDTVGIATDQPKWLQGRYKMVRYEDMAEDPIRITRDIYNFVGLQLTDQILNWVHENTNVTESNMQETFGTHKNSSATASSWRRYLSMEEVDQVQNICGDMMSLLGYALIENEADLKNPKVPVTKPLKLSRDITLT